MHGHEAQLGYWAGDGMVAVQVGVGEEVGLSQQRPPNRESSGQTGSALGWRRDVVQAGGGGGDVSRGAAAGGGMGSGCPGPPTTTAVGVRYAGPSELGETGRYEVTVLVVRGRTREDPGPNRLS